ncbi:MAG: glycine cleavage system protein GcvH, partial [Candidatus Bathyarchaeia archaeon]
VSEAIRLRLEELMRAEGIPAAKREELLAIPEQLLYTPKHTWAQITPEGNIRVGVSDYAQRHLKGIASIMTEPVGKEVAKMEPFGVIETWMFMFDLYSPISGKIVKFNEKLKDKPYLINEDPYGEGWIVEIKPKNSLTLEEELKGLLSSREYNKWVSKLEGRLRE